MKLLILLSIIASGYGDKLDRTYLPPANAGSAGGSPGALTGPGLSGFGTTGPSNQKLFGQQPFGLASIPSSFGQKTYEPTTGQQSSGSLDSKLNIPSFGPSPVYGPIGGRPVQGNDGLNSGLTSNAPLGSAFNQPQSSNIPSNDLVQKPSSSTFGSNSPSFAYSQTNDQSVSGISSQIQPERPQAAADRNAEIIRYVNENDGDRFTYNFETSNGISAEEAGVASGGVKAQGGYSYTGDDGKAYTITYTADERGYQPQGEHLPTPHPIPEEILRSIEKNAQAAAAGTQEGAYRPEEYESEANAQGYSGAISFNRPQSEDQYSNQQYSAPSGRPASGSIGFQQTRPQNQNIQTGQPGFTGNENQPSNIEGPIRSSNQGLGSPVQNESQRKSGYQYSRPQNIQYNSVPEASSQTLGAPSSQSLPQFGPQPSSNSVFPTIGNRQTIKTINSDVRPNYQNIPINQGSVKPSQVQQYQSSNSNGPVNQSLGQGSQSQPNSRQNGGSSGYQYQPGTSNTKRPNFPAQNRNQGAIKPNVGNQYQPNSPNQLQNRPSVNNKYQPQNIPSLSTQNGFNRPNEGAQNIPNNQASMASNNGNNLSLGFPNSVTKGSAPIQAPYQYQRPSQPFNQNQGLSQPDFRQPSGNQAQPISNQPAFGLQTDLNQNQRPLQSTFNSQNVGPSESNLNNRPSQVQGSSRPGYNGPSQVSTPTFPSEQFSGPRQPPSFNSEEGYKY